MTNRGELGAHAARPLAVGFGCVATLLGLAVVGCKEADDPLSCGPGTHEADSVCVVDGSGGAGGGGGADGSGGGAGELHRAPGPCTEKLFGSKAQVDGGVEPSAVTVFQYDEAGRLLAATTTSNNGDIPPTEIGYTLNERGLLETITSDGFGIDTTVTLTWDDADALLESTVELVTGAADGQAKSKSYVYDGAGRVATFLQSATITEQGELLSSFERSATCSYDEPSLAGSCACESHATEGGVVLDEELPCPEWQFDATWRVASLTGEDLSATVTDFEYGPDGQVTLATETTPQGARRIAYRYDANGNLTEMEWLDEPTALRLFDYACWPAEPSDAQSPCGNGGFPGAVEWPCAARLTGDLW